MLKRTETTIVNAENPQLLHVMGAHRDLIKAEMLKDHPKMLNII
jgi:hypothetical protein